MEQHLRIARPTGDLERIVAQYRDGLGFEIIGKFENHNGFDGAMLGRSRSGSPYHLEFTCQRGHPAEGVPGAENLLVFYIPDTTEWLDRCKRAELAGFCHVPSSNPYWHIRGRTFKDLDGYRVVLQNAPWPPES